MGVFPYKPFSLHLQAYPDMCKYIIFINESESELTQLCLTLCDPMDCSLPGSSVHGILQARILDWVAISFSRESFHPRDRNPGLPHCRQILLPPEPLGKSIFINIIALSVCETWVLSLGWEDPLKKGKAIYSSILAWGILWTV